MSALTTSSWAGRLTAVVAAGSLVVAAPAGPAAACPVRQYRVIDLGFTGEVLSLADAGYAAGRGEFTPGRSHPFLWRRGQVRDLGELTPTYEGSGAATDVNNRGQVVGYSTIGQKSPPVDRRAFLWQNGRMTALDLPGTDAQADAINDRGEIVGTYTVQGVGHAFLWRHGVVTDLGRGNATDINNRGRIVGARPGRQGRYVPCVWYRGRVTDLPLGPATAGGAAAVNDSGWIVGHGTSEADSEGVESAYLWRAGTVTDLGRIGIGDSAAADVDDRGRIIGVTGLNNFSDPIAFLWQRGRMTDLRTHGVRGGVRAISHGWLGGSMPFGDGGYHAAVYR
ncbi:hypothetical protein [Nucisporomicrobium flavum]|uniref:hypothetical protein n=1 Tax=Nucisporomicrobium flavum TaxID=2785915 RepID=UPI0018F4CA43|nr:hypothetical protein [Nucisporomicrobium flavum]